MQPGRGFVFLMSKYVLSRMNIVLYAPAFIIGPWGTVTTYNAKRRASGSKREGALAARESALRAASNPRALRRSANPGAGRLPPRKANGAGRLPPRKANAAVLPIARATDVAILPMMHAPEAVVQQAEHALGTTAASSRRNARVDNRKR